jgi:hypothetical protein
MKSAFFLLGGFIPHQLNQYFPCFSSISASSACPTYKSISREQNEQQLVASTKQQK